MSDIVSRVTKEEYIYTTIVLKAKDGTQYCKIMMWSLLQQCNQTITPFMQLQQYALTITSIHIVVSVLQ